MPSFDKNTALQLGQLLVPLLLGITGYYMTTTVAPVANLAEENKQQLVALIAINAELSRLNAVEQEKVRRLEAEIDAEKSARREMQTSINNLYIKLATMERK